ncbi:MAG: plasmid mobilization protein [Solirubrobacteraceae bacterium]
MSDSHPPHRDLGRRRRPKLTDGQRRVQMQVRLSESEREQLRTIAAQQGVSVPRLLVEAALGAGESPAGRRAVMGQLFELRRLLATVANNVNQLARLANISGEVPARSDGALRDVRDLMVRIDVALDELAGRRA